LPDAVTYGATACGVLAAFVLTPDQPLLSAAFAVLRALIAASALLGLRTIHQRLRGIEGLGLGDVKLAAAIGAWLPLDHIPFCFALAASAALASVAFRASRSNFKTLRVPFGAYLCPALWLVFFVSALPA
jgi:leader peptidase (prepilin peptidase)/N-methyltransferase